MCWKGRLRWLQKVLLMSVSCYTFYIMQKRVCRIDLFILYWYACFYMFIHRIMSTWKMCARFKRYLRHKIKKYKRILFHFHFLSDVYSFYNCATRKTQWTIWINLFRLKRVHMAYSRRSGCFWCIFMKIREEGFASKNFRCEI